MQTAKIIGAGVCALFAIGSLFSLLGKMSSGLNFSDSQTIISIVVLIVGAALAVVLWKGATTRTPRG